MSQPAKRFALSQFGTVNIDFLVGVPSTGHTTSQRVTSMVLLANTPQVLIAFVYIFYNDIIMAMFYSYSFMRHAKERRFLRLSAPPGRQGFGFTLGRIIAPFYVKEPDDKPLEQYQLGLPWFIAYPFIASLSLLHWLVSQSIFLVYIEHYSVNNSPDPSKNLIICGYSPAAIMFASILGTILFVTLISLGLFKFQGGMPLLSTCSLTISAACHSAGVEPEYEQKRPDPGLKKIQYGVLPSQPGQPRRVGFSQHSVTPLVTALVYQ